MNELPHLINLLFFRTVALMRMKSVKKAAHQKRKLRVSNHGPFRNSLFETKLAEVLVQLFLFNYREQMKGLQREEEESDGGRDSFHS